MTQVQSAMTRRVSFAVETDDLRQIYNTMRALGVRHVPVTRDGKVVGMLSDRDFLLHGHPDKDGALVVPAKPVSEVMSAPVVTCSESDTIGGCVDALLAHGIDSLAVVDGAEKLIGILTTTDLLRLLRDSDWRPTQRVPFQWESIPILSAWRAGQPAHA